MQRVRISKACEGCRTKKTKCDGLQSCGACNYRGEECIYSDAPSKRKQPRKQYVRALETRIANLEQQIGGPAASQEGQSNEDESSSLDLHPQSSWQDATLPEPVPVKTSSSDADADELADMLGSFNLDDGGELRFYGACSNFHLIQDKTAFDDPSSRTARLQGIEAAKQTVGLPNVSDELQDHLLDLFWRWQNSWQYLVARDVFLSDLKASKSTRFCSPLLLASILALASRYSDRLEVRTDPKDSKTAGAIFAVQAKTMLHHECVAPTVATVQATALLALYSSGINQESLGWMYSGMAVRMAFTLGLNLDCSSYLSRGLISQAYLESRNVAWWGVFVLDNLFTLGIGRPSTIRDYDITAGYPSLNGDLPLQRLDEVSDSSTHPMSYVATTATYTCKLIHIAKVLDPLYSVNPGWSKDERKRRVAECHIKLIDFHDSLPPQLRPDSSTCSPALPHVYILHLQFYSYIILLHKPFISNFAKPIVEKTAGSRESLHVLACRSSAERICTLLQDFKTHYSLRYIPLSGVQAVFTAAVIFLHDLLHTDGATWVRARRELDFAIGAMEEMSETWNWSGRCLRSILSLAKQSDVDTTTVFDSRDKPPSSVPVDFERKDADNEDWLTAPMNLSSWMNEETATTQDWDIDIANSKALDDIFLDQSWIDMMLQDFNGAAQ